MGAQDLASVDGRISPTTEAFVPLPDDGLYRGDGVFEVIRLYGGRPFALDDHLSRIERSARAIDLPIDRDAVERELERLVARNGDADAQLRIILTRGGRRILLIEPVAPHDSTVRLASVVYSPTVILNRVKSLSYGANMHATRLAKAAGADEAVLVTPEGVVLEPPTSTVFWAGSDGVLRTPSLELPILDSITRQRIVEAVDVEEGSYDIAELRGASEAFLASTTREVQPVAAIDDVTFEGPGPRTRECAEAFAAIVARELGTGA